MNDCTCTLCGPCADQGIDAASATPNKYGQQENKAESSSNLGQPFRSLSFPNAVIVYILGSINNKPKQIDIFSSLNGWHIRTLPANRFINPVLIGAGAEKLAVVERFPDYDLIRITDEYAGATRAAYDAWGFPLSNVDFSMIQDFRQIRIPRGMSVTGLKILENGMLIAGLSSGNDNFFYLKALVDTIPINLAPGNPIIVGGPFDASPWYEGIRQLPTPFDTCGAPSGSFAIFDANANTRRYQVFTSAQHSIYGPSILLIDFWRNTVEGHFGLPTGATVISMHQSGEIINVLLSTNEIIRMKVSDLNYCMCGMHSDAIVQPPQEFSVYHTFSPQDDPFFANIPAPTVNDILAYLQFTGYFNKNSNYFGANTLVQGDNVVTTTGIIIGSVLSLLTLLLNGGIIDASDPTNPILTQPGNLPFTPDPVFTPITPSSDSITESNYRIGVATTYTTSWGNITFAAQSIPNGTNQPIYIEGSSDTISELYTTQDPTTGKVDITKAQFMLLHGSHYDWLSRGGFTYGCTNAASTIAQTNGLVGISIATDISGELGQHKDLPDLKVVLYDTLTGLILYREPKPLGVQVYGGTYADLEISPTVINIPIESQCGINIDAEASGLDGIDRDDTNTVPPNLGNGYPVMSATEIPVLAWGENPLTPTSMTNPGDFNFPWQYFVRRAQGLVDTEAAVGGGIQYVTKVTPKLSAWSTVNPTPTGDILPWWRNLTNPCVTTFNGQNTNNSGAYTDSTSGLLYPVLGSYAADNDPNGIHEPQFVANALGGFFFLSLPQIQTTSCQIAQATVSNQVDNLSQIQSAATGAITQANLPALSAQATTLQQQITQEQQIINTLTLVPGGSLTANPDPANDTIPPGSGTGPLLPEQTAVVNSIVSSLEAQVSVEQTNVTLCDPNNPANIVFEVQPTVSALSVPINALPSGYSNQTQDIDPILGGFDEIPPIIPPGTPPWQSITIPGDPAGIKRGIVIDPGIRSWLAVEVKLNRDNGVTGDGQSNWTQPAARTGRLGLRVGAAANTDIINNQSPTTLYPFCGGIIPGYVYDAGDIASGGATGEWEVAIYANGTPIASISTPVTFAEQISSLAPGDIQTALQNVFSLLDDGGGVDPTVGMHFGKVYFSPEIVNTITIKVSLVNYAYDVYRYGMKTIQYVNTKDENTGQSPGQPGDPYAIITGFRANSISSYEYGPTGPLIQQFTYGADPGYYCGNNCEAFCFGNVTCNSYVFQGSKLCQSDPTDAVVRNVLWEGIAVYTIPTSNNPYTAENIGVGNYINAYFEFQLNGGNFNYDINLRSGEGRTQGGGSCQ